MGDIESADDDWLNPNLELTQYQMSLIPLTEKEFKEKYENKTVEDIKKLIDDINKILVSNAPLDDHNLTELYKKRDKHRKAIYQMMISKPFVEIKSMEITVQSLLNAQHHSTTL